MPFKKPHNLCNSWEDCKDKFEKEAGKRKPGSGLSNKSGIREALAPFDAAAASFVWFLNKDVDSYEDYAELERKLAGSRSSVEAAYTKFMAKWQAYSKIVNDEAKGGRQVDQAEKVYLNAVAAFSLSLHKLQREAEAFVEACKDREKEWRKKAKAEIRSIREREGAESLVKLKSVVASLKMGFAKQNKALSDLEKNPGSLPGFENLDAKIEKYWFGFERDIRSLGSSIDNKMFDDLLLSWKTYRREALKIKESNVGKGVSAARTFFDSVAGWKI